MKIKLAIIICVVLSSHFIFSQKTEVFNPKGTLFFGAEFGFNAITSVHQTRMTSLQGGILAEYYFAKNWSVNGRLKYFETGIFNENSKQIESFDGVVISLPINLIWKYRLIKNFGGNFKLGIAFNQEVKSNYNYPPGKNTNFSKFYSSFNPGVGINYFISKNTALYINYEVYVLGNHRGDSSGFYITPYSPNNNLLNFGIKHNFKKEVEKKQ